MEIRNEILKGIWKDRYQKNGESIDENIDRVADYVSSNKSEFNEFSDTMKEGLFFPAGRTMSNAGVGRDLTLNNCFTAPQIQDSLDDIFDKVKLGSVTHQKGGGIGYDFSQIRPSGTPTSNEAVASGAISFMDVFNAQTATILQGNRRGANMGAMSIYSMDIVDFILAKSTDTSKLNHFNVSVVVDDDFMVAVENNKTISLHYPVYNDDGKIEKSPENWKMSKEIDANYLWNLIMEMAYTNGEPGVFFYDNMNRDNTLGYIENIVVSNPCAEYLAGTIYGKHPKTNEKLDPSQYGGACNLGSIFVHRFVSNPFTDEAYVDFEKMKATIKMAVRFLDNIIDINNFPDKIYENYQKAFRTIGLGITGLGDMLTMLGMQYDTKKATSFVDALMDFIALNAFRASVELAKEKGAFPLLDNKAFVNSGYIQKHAKNNPEWKELADDILEHGIRNAKIMSVAPTGTISMTFGENCSSGLEPIFSLEYDRKVKVGGQSDDDIEIVKMRDYAYGLWLETKNKTVDESVFKTAMNMDVDAHVEMLATIAYHIDMSCSKTINIPTEYSFEATKEVYYNCWKKGVKGCTIFRPNPIRQGILMVEEEKNTETVELNTSSEELNQLPWGLTLAPSSDMIGRKRKLMTGCGALHVQAWFDPLTGRCMEVFLSKGGSGGCLSFQNGLSRMTSLALRTGADFKVVVDQLKSTTTCPSYAVRAATKKDTSKGNSCPTGLANALLEMQEEIYSILGTSEEDTYEIYSAPVSKETTETVELVDSRTICPECGGALRHEGGCDSCQDCGYSKCG